MVAGDLNSHEALWLCNCPVINEELDIWHHINGVRIIYIHF